MAHLLWPGATLYGESTLLAVEWTYQWKEAYQGWGSYDLLRDDYCTYVVEVSILLHLKIHSTLLYSRVVHLQLTKPILI